MIIILYGIEFYSKVKTSNPIPYLNKKLTVSHNPELINHNYNYLIHVDNDGFLMTKVKYDTDKDDSEYHQYVSQDYESGFLALLYFHNAHIITKLDHYYLVFQMNNNDWQCSIPQQYVGQVTKVIENPEEVKPKTMTPNWLDLGHDPNYAGVGQHIANAKQKDNYSPTFNNLCFLNAKARYVPSFHNDIFKHAIHLKKQYLVSIEPHGLLFIGLDNRANNFFFLNYHNYFLNNRNLENEALEDKDVRIKQFIVTTKHFILRLNIDNGSLQNYFYFQMHPEQFQQYIASLDPIFTSPVTTKKFIKTNYQKIANDYIKNNPKATNTMNFKDEDAICTDIFTLFLYLATMDPGKNSPWSDSWIVADVGTVHMRIFFLVIIPILVIILSTAWWTYAHSQVIKPTTAIMLTIAVVIFLIIVAGL